MYIFFSTLLLFSLVLLYQEWTCLAERFFIRPRAPVEWSVTRKPYVNELVERL